MKKVIIILAMALSALSANAVRTVECEIPEVKGWSANYNDENTSISFTPVKAKLTVKDEKEAEEIADVHKNVKFVDKGVHCIPHSSYVAWKIIPAIES